MIRPKPSASFPNSAPFAESATLGATVNALFRRSCASPPWEQGAACRTKRKAAAAFSDLLIHDIDMANVVVGAHNQLSAIGPEDSKKRSDV